MKKKQKDLVRVYAILQHNAGSIANIAGCFSKESTAKRVCKNLNNIYKQYYYVESVLLDYDCQKTLAIITGKVNV